MGSNFSRFVQICGFVALLLICIGLLMGKIGKGIPALAPSPEKLPHQLSLEEFHRFVQDKNGLVLDARNELLYRKGHVPRALSLPLDRFQPNYVKLKPLLEADKALPIIIYCAGIHCGASVEVQRKLVAMGYTQTAVFLEGWPAWQAAKLPEEVSNGGEVPLAPWKKKR
jgi:rhodanese-related sulfurtransferase